MKKLSKGIFCLSGIFLIGVITISFFNTNNKNLKEVKINDKRLAVFIKQEDGSYKTATSIPQSGYTLNTEKSTCSKGAIPTWSNNTLNLANLTTENTNCYLYFDEEVSTKKLREMGLTANTGTPDFSQVATTDEGVYSVADGMYGGTSYYWRGAATTNYVKFAGFCWRAIRINGDGSIRLIYDGTSCHANGISTAESIAKTDISYNSQYNNSAYVGWTYTASSQRPSPSTGGTASNAKTQLESWYSSNITGTNASKVADGKYCNDKDVRSGDTWSATGSSFKYAATKRIITDHSPSLACNASDIYTLSLGLITADEVTYVGGVYGTNNTSYYLYNGQNYWTMSPSYWDSTYAQVFYVNVNGRLTDIGVNYTTPGLRPVINLKSDTLFKSGGNGTIDNPFIVEGAE